MSTYSATQLSLPGVLLITPTIFFDERGYSVETYQAETFDKLGIGSGFAQDFVSRSTKGVIRGMHFQHAPYAQDKLVRCAQGEIFDVVADIDLHSSTFGKYVSVTLAAYEQAMLLVPGKYAHGYCVTSEDATVEYKIRGDYRPNATGGVLWSDPLLNIAWPTQTPILSQKDATLPTLRT